MTQNTQALLEKGYLQDGEKTWEDIARRVADTIGKAESDETYKEEFFKLINDMDFIPSTPCLINAGTETQQLSSCFILPVNDSIESIFKAQSEMAKIFQTNGGVGLNVSALRPSNSPVVKAGGKSCGCLGFMELFDLTADLITRNNLRKGALKIDLDVWHPDILDFIKCKDDTTKLTHMNISVALPDRFMRAVESNDIWTLEFPDYIKEKKFYDSLWDGDLGVWKSTGFKTVVYKQLPARELYNLIMNHAWRTGEPGVNFPDNMNINNPNPHIGKTNRTNPCGEFVSVPYNSCILGSINLSHMVSGGGVFLYDKLRKTIKLAVRFLDDMISVNRLPLQTIDQVSKSWRSIGLGTMGLADALYMAKIRYASPECLSFLDGLYSTIFETAKNASVDLAAELNVYDFWEHSEWERKEIAIRNSNLLSIAPTGSISFIANTSGGLEPNFALAYTRRMHDGTEFTMINPVFESVLKEYNLFDNSILNKITENNGSCQTIQELPQEIKDIFVIASDLTPDEHLDVLTTIQKHVDLACSKTINLSHSVTVSEIENVYIKAWKGKAKGCTVYRDGSRANQTLSVKNSDTASSAKFDYISPIKKIELGKTYGVNTKHHIACGKIYLNICRDKKGNLVEIFINTGKGGICQSNINGLSRLISIALRSGIKVEEIANQLIGIHCPACTIAMANHKKIEALSCPDLIGKVLLKEYKNADEAKQSTKCPECDKELVPETGCLVCKNCGWTRCR